jgi:hypothetical protein
MKNLIRLNLVLLLSVILSVSTVFAGNKIFRDGENFIKVGTKMVYAVVNGDKKYDFIVTVKQLSPELIFDWEMTAPVNTKGTITIPQKDMQHAMAFYNYFSPGSLTLDGETSVWLSNDQFNQIKNNRYGIFKLDGKNGKETPMKVIRNTPNMPIPVITPIVNGKPMTLNTIYLNNGILGENMREVVLLDSKDFPIIVKMNLGWTITLKEIK